ncbi:MAG: hypothetical protein IJX80_04035 [Clostridia bacterium]|nr:hypothetical protein [Clostridia bacterium]
MNYEYAPRFPKKKEKLLAYGMLGLAALLFVTSYLPNMPYPGMIQILGLGALVAMIMIFSMCIARQYTYSIEEREGAAPDFIITEHYGMRVTVVCRVAVTSVMTVMPWNDEAKKSFAATKKGKQAYIYTGVLFDEVQYCLNIEEDGTDFFVRICADETLVRLLTSH